MLFLVIVFVFKKTSLFKNTEIFQRNNPENGLTYGDLTIEDLVNKDTDGDGIPDWQEGLYGLDPTKKETTPGTPDSSALSKLRVEQGIWSGGDASAPENLTQTEKFSRELFATVAALNQNGPIDQATIDALSNSLATKIENSVQRKVYTISDIKISDDNRTKAIKTYSDALENIDKKYPTKIKKVMDILQEFSSDENNPDVNILAELDPIIEEKQKCIIEILKITVPQSLSLLHLAVINDSQKLLENVSDIRLFDSDPIVAMGATMKYEDNILSLVSSSDKLTNTIKQKLNN